MLWYNDARNGPVMKRRWLTGIPPVDLTNPAQLPKSALTTIRQIGCGARRRAHTEELVNDGLVWPNSQRRGHRY